MDLLDNEEDIIDVKQRLDNFINSEKPLVKGENRSHYISAKAALKSILNGTSNEHLQAFHNFTNYLEQFLIFERGKLKINQAITKIHELTNSSLDGLEQSVEILEGKIKFSETEKQEIIEKIGEASGRDVKIRILGEQTIKQATQEAEESWNKLQEGLKAYLTYKSQNWNSLHNPSSAQKKLIADYSNCFNRDLKIKINYWENQELGNSILEPNVKLLNTKIEIELEAVKASFQNISNQVETNLYEQIKFSIDEIKDDFTAGGGGVIGGFGIGALAAGLLLLTPLGLIAVAGGSIAAAIGGFLGLELLDLDSLTEQIKIKVLESGLQNFEKSKDKNFEKLHEIVESAIVNKVQEASQVIEQVISLYENLLKQQDKVHQETLEQRNAEKAWVTQKSEELKQLQKEIDTKYS